MAWTQTQQSAIDETQRHMGVSAGAGSGKTSVMVERAVSLVESGVDIHEILMVTFTRAATAEMKERIRKQLRERAEKINSTRLRRQAAMVATASISTIDSFCQDLVREFFSMDETNSGMEPRPIASGVEEAALSQRAIRQTLDEEFLAKNADFYALLDRLGGEKNVIELLQSAERMVSVMPDPQAAWAQMDAGYRTAAQWIPRYLQERGAERKETILRALASLQDCIRDAYGWAENTKDRQKIAEMEEARLSILTMLKQDVWMLDAEDFNKAEKSLANRKKQTDAEKQRIKKTKEIFKSLKSDKFFEIQPQEYLQMSTQTANVAAAFVRIGRAFYDAYARQRERAGVASFGDVQHQALTLLRCPGVQEELKRRYRYLFVDEYQDINPLQQSILDLLPGNMFFVGDIKQSIYGFREADPTLFWNRLEEYRHREDAVAVDLVENFRSTPEIIDAVNAVFEASMTAERGGIDYRLHHSMQAMSAEHGEKPQLWLFLKNTAQAQCAAIAQEIQRLYLCKREYKDMAVLTRTRSQMRAVCAALKQVGIPVAAEKGSALQQTQALSDVLNLLRLIDHPDNEIALIGVMLLFGFEARELAEIRSAANTNADGAKLTFGAAVRAAAQGRGEYAQRIAKMLEALQEYEWQARSIGIEATIRRLCEDFTAQFGLYAREDEGIEQLLEYARGFEQAAGGGLYEFLQAVEYDLASGGGELAQPPCGEGNAVRVMTMHASKGLQFPIVFLPFLERPRAEHNNKNYFLEKGYGLVLKEPDRVGNLVKGCLWEVAQQQRSKRDAEEDQRLLYVAMTRAEKSLYLFSGLTLEEQKQWNDNSIWGMLSTKKMSYFLLMQGPKLHRTITVREIEEQAEPQSLQESARSWWKSASLEQMEYVRREMARPYRHEEAVHLPQRISPSGFSQAQAEGTQALQPLKRPRFAQPDQLSPTERGTLHHRVLALLPLHAYAGGQEVQSAIEELCAKELLSDSEARAIELPWLLSYLQSPLYARVCAAKKVYREVPFQMLEKAKDLWKDTNAEDEVMVQGIADCVFEEEGKLVLIDFKTDYVQTEDMLQEKKERYALQIQLYEKALSRALKAPISQSCLFFLRSGQQIDL